MKHHFLIAVFLSVVVGAPAVASAQGDEIQVYTGGLAPVGVFNLTWHNNYTPDGIKTPEFPGAITSNKSLNGVTEWAYGITDWFEGGLYLPLYSRDENLGWKIDGFKLRTLFAVPHADDRTFVYGVNIVQLQREMVGYQAFHLRSPSDCRLASQSVRSDFQSDCRHAIRRFQKSHLRAVIAPRV